MNQNQNQNQIQQQQKIGIAALKSVLNNDSIKQKFVDMLGKKAQGFITSVINVCSNNKMLANAEANSIVLAAANAAALDLPIDPNLGYAAIVPFNDKNKGCVVATFQIMRNGWVELAQRTCKIKKLNCEAVYEGELVSKNRFTEEYVFDENKRKSDTVIGYMAYLATTDGFEKTIYWTIDDMKRHAMRYSQTFKKGYGLWLDNFDAMAKKTLTKHIIVKFAPKSISTALYEAASKDEAAFTGDINNPQPVYVDNQQEEQVEEFQEAVVVVEEDGEEHQVPDGVNPETGEMQFEEQQ